MAHTENALLDTTASMSTEPDDNGKIYTAEQLDKVSHIIGAVQLETLEKDIIPQDDPSLYTYSIQLMEGKEFTGSIVEVTEDKLERDRTTWNKALLKKFLKDCLARDPAVGSPWSAKVVWFEKYKEQYGFKEELPQHLKEKSDELRADLLQRRRKVCSVFLVKVLS
jgi:bromodomain adjacent to zinc finger domain protein 1A